MSDEKVSGPKYVNETGRVIAGGAAELHVIKQAGGWVPYHEKIVQRTIEEISKTIAASILAEQNRELIKGTMKRVK